MVIELTCPNCGHASLLKAWNQAYVANRNTYHRNLSTIQAIKASDYSNSVCCPHCGHVVDSNMVNYVVNDSIKFTVKRSIKQAMRNNYIRDSLTKLGVLFDSTSDMSVLQKECTVDNPRPVFVVNKDYSKVRISDGLLEGFVGFIYFPNPEILADLSKANKYLLTFRRDISSTTVQTQWNIYRGGYSEFDLERIRNIESKLSFIRIRKCARITNHRIKYPHDEGEKFFRFSLDGETYEPSYGYVLRYYDKEFRYK
jgi:predicted RNA-binding Zn-ribbon protein involved in translation (DUF1610 family)